MKYFKLKIIGSICLALIGSVLFWLNSTSGRVVRDNEYFSKRPKTVQELRSMLKEIEEKIPRLKFDPNFINDAEKLQALLHEIQRLNIVPEFIIEINQLIEDVESVAAEKLQSPVTTDIIYITELGTISGASLVTKEDEELISKFGIDSANFATKNEISVIKFSLNGLLKIYEVTNGIYKESIKGLIAHELGHNLSGLSRTIPDGAWKSQIQAGFQHQHVKVVQFDFTSYDNLLPYYVIIDRLKEIVADKIALQLTSTSTWLSSEKVLGAIDGYDYALLTPLDAGPKSIITIFYAWKIATARAFGLTEVADSIKRKFGSLSTNPEHQEIFNKLIIDFENCFERYGLEIPR